MANKKAKKAKRKKGLNLGVLRRGAKSRNKKLKANIKKRSKEITRAQTRGDTKTVKHQKDMQRRAQAVVAGLEKIVAQMPDDCPFTGQIDPLMS
jgi:hypothetical protein